MLKHCILLVLLLIPSTTYLLDEERLLSFSQPGVWKFGTAAMGNRARSVVNKVLSIEQAEGMGARVRRSVGGAKVNLLGISLAPPQIVWYM